ncbi:MAG TPA: hypothetical protein VMX94_02625 [Armatimonadota bacterium]|nr:hypothetical protein [Armatimonadota bacterium]
MNPQELDTINQAAAEASKPRKPLTPEERAKRLAQAYARTQGMSEYNYETILTYYFRQGFTEEEVLPRVTVLTENAWKHLGRIVEKDAEPCIITLWPKNRKTGERYARPCSVYHLSQTKVA